MLYDAVSERVHVSGAVSLNCFCMILCNARVESVFYFHARYTTTDQSHDASSPVAVLGKNIWWPGPSSFGRQQRLSEIIIEPIII